jgi:hypothetical protein
MATYERYYHCRREPFTLAPTRASLYEVIAEELGCNLIRTANPVYEADGYLLSTYKKGGTMALIFDEAQSIQI